MCCGQCSCYLRPAPPAEYSISLFTFLLNKGCHVTTSSKFPRGGREEAPMITQLRKLRTLQDSEGRSQGNISTKQLMGNRLCLQVGQEAPDIPFGEFAITMGIAVICQPCSSKQLLTQLPVHNPNQLTAPPS